MYRYDWLGFACVLLLVAAVLLVRLFYLLSQSRALAACHPSRRAISPGMVWLNVVPFGHLFLRFWTVIALGNSLRREYDARGLRTGHSFGKGSGITVAVLAVIARLVVVAGFLLAMFVFESGWPFYLSLWVAGLLGLVELVMVSVHWAIVAGFTRELASTRSAGVGGGGGDRDPERNQRDFDEDYRPIPRRRKRAEAEYDG